MLKANRVSALGLPLAEGGHAVLAQEGPECNGLRKFKCIAPPQLDGQTIIATKDNEGSPMTAAFGRLFDMDDSERWVVVMTSPELGAQLQK